MVLNGLVGLVSLVFHSHKAILGGNDIINEAAIWHESLIHKKRIIRWVLDGLFGLFFHFVWLLWFFQALHLSFEEIKHNQGS